MSVEELALGTELFYEVYSGAAEVANVWTGGWQLHDDGRLVFGGLQHEYYDECYRGISTSYTTYVMPLKTLYQE